ncbi:response regulator [Eleftheria terrae]|uniref:response regulator n=1 Tax=Eleftheria terrae TaxID=1597781 RepID=UPI00263AFB7E|nr:response regulator [Eleftheria terrae]WKB53512.1 PAS domain-containing protein [Eleftheria terrae]
MKPPVPARILLLEDSDIDAELLCSHLLKARPELEIIRAVRRSEYEAALRPGELDLILADYSLPDYDGLTALQLAQERLPDVPFIFVSGVLGEDVAVEALRQGATDYVLKRSLGRLPRTIERALADARERQRRRQAEAALGDSEANMRLALAAAELGLWHYVPAEDRLGWDSRSQLMFGLPGQPQVRHEELLARVSPADRDGLRSAMQAAMQPGGEDLLLREFRTHAADGSERWVVMRGQAFFERGRCHRVSGVVQDVTDQKAAEARQRQTELLFRLAAEAAGIGVWELDIEGDRLWFDAGLRTLADVPDGPVPDYATMLHNAVHPDDRAEVDRSLRAALRPGAPPELEYEHRMIGLQGGRMRWVAVKGRRIVGSDGRPRLVGTARDVTEQRRRDEVLRQVNRDLEASVAQRTRERDRIWNLSVDLMAVCRPDATLTSVNPAWESVLGWSAEALQEASLLDFLHPDEVADTRQRLRSLAHGSVTRTQDSRLRHRDGGWRWIRWTASADNGLVYAIGRDVTEERAAAEELAATNRELKAQISERSRVENTLQQMQRLEAVGQLTSGVAHDFNNLLTVVLSNIGLIERLLQQRPESVDERVVQRLDSMRNAAQRGATLTTQLLAFSRRQRLEPQEVDFNDVVAGMRDLLQTTMGGSVAIETALAPRLWPALVDPTQLELIILNLAINARDAMEVGGTLTVRTGNVTLQQRPARPEEPEPGDYVSLTVSDTGSGMSDEVLAKAFEPFFTTKEVGKGSGLGLAQVYGFAKQSGGGVRIETEPGRGTSVHVYMPRAPASAASRPGSTEPENTGATAQQPPQPTHTVLLVDDDEDVREVTAALLELDGYTVLQARNGAAALEMVARCRDIDAVIADFAMPGMNGAELGRALQRSHPALPVLYVTGFADLAALRDVHEDYVLQKPLPHSEMASRLQRVLATPASRRLATQP